LRVDVGAALAVAVAAAPITLTFAVQGLLQGRERFGALATVAALVGVTRVSRGRHCRGRCRAGPGRRDVAVRGRVGA
jgi:hypothetical protein